MAIIGIGTGTCTLGRRQVDKDGNIIKETKASWEPDPNGGSVAIWPIDPETNEASGPASIFGDWDAAHYLPEVLHMLQPSRKTNIPDFRHIIMAAQKGGTDICGYCENYYDGMCSDCIITEWQESEEDNE